MFIHERSTCLFMREQCTGIIVLSGKGFQMFYHGLLQSMLPRLLKPKIETLKLYYLSSHYLRNKSWKQNVF